MDDIDDYFDDDLLLDEGTLAILDREERKYLSQKHQPPPAVTKKQKTRDGWSPGVGSRPREHDFDDLPEISVTADGNYGFTDPSPTSGSSNLGQLPLPLFNTPLQKGQDLPNGRPFPRAQPAPAPLRLTVSTASNCASPAPNARPKNAPTNSLFSNRNAKQFELQKQIAELQAQLQELKNQNQKVQTALKEATDIRYAKEGEVSILRKNIEKTAQSHATEIAKMKAAREEVEAKQKQMERQMKEETERLKTQFIFKQHELEASLRRPASVRATRTLKNAPATPVRVPSQISAWRINQGADFGQSLSQTPRRDSSLQRSPQAAHAIHKSPEVLKRPGFFPGFQNSFTSTPLKPNIRINFKGKGRDLGREESIEAPLQPTAVSPVHQRSADSFDFNNHVDVAPASDDPLPHIDDDGDSIMFDDNPEAAEEAEPIELLNHKAELSRITLTHTHMEANEATFQLLINLPFITTLSDTQARECTRAARSILLALSNPVDDSDYEICSRQVTNYLIMILQCLLDVDPCVSTVALLNLLRSFALLLPEFTKLLESTSDNGIPLFVVLFDLLDRLAGPSSDKGAICIKETFSLLEVLLFDIPDETVNRLTLILPTRISSLFSFLNPSQSCETLESLSRAFLLLATYSPFRGQMLTLVQGDSGASDHRDSPFLYNLCTYLLDNFRSSFVENSATYGNLLSCLAQLSLSQAELLVQSSIVIPTLTYMIAEISMVLWNYDGSSLAASQSRLFIRFINQTLFLLHHLIYSSEPIIRLHDKLQHCSHHNLDNLVHMFIVSFGQLSYADPPDWIDVEGKVELENLVDIARGLLDLAVDGPEGDSIWAAYQMEPDNESETDDEEREARLMESDMQS